MKKIVSLFVVFVMLVSFTANASNMEFLTEPYPNYTGEKTIQIRFESSEELANLINEIDYSGEIEKYFDLKTFLKSLLSLNSKMLLQVDMSDDMKSVKMALTSETNQTIDVNKNLSADVRTKEGMWMTMDFSDMENPVYRIIYSQPFMNKYMVIDLPELMGEEFYTYAEFMQNILSPEFMESANKLVTESLKKHADLKLTYSKCVLSIDNDALMNIAEDVIGYTVTTVSEVIGESESEEFVNFFSGIDLSGIKVLGKEGIKYTCYLKKGKIEKAETFADIDIDLEAIYNRFAGSEWEFQSQGKFEMSIKTSEIITSVGRTKVVFPTLTAENHINVADKIPVYEEYELEEPSYPSFYVWADSKMLPVVDGEIYVPLRKTMESAYEETVAIEFNDGVIKASCEYFPGFRSITLSNKSDKVYTENGEFQTKPIFIKKGVTYVANSLFTELFGWEFASADYNMIEDEYYYSFYTDTY